jgi:hypothetical protein
LEVQPPVPPELLTVPQVTWPAGLQPTLNSQMFAVVDGLVLVMQVGGGGAFPL